MESIEEHEQQNEIREELKSMSFEELMKLKEKLGAKVYKEAIFGVSTNEDKRQKKASDFKRLNKNRPREQSSKRQVPFLGIDHNTSKKDEHIRDPRFDDQSGTYDAKTFKHNYQFLIDVRNKDIQELKKKLANTDNKEEAANIKHAIQRLKNKNIEEKNWHMKQALIEEEKMEIKKARELGQKPHYATKKERRAKELVKKFEDLKKTGKLTKHLEKRRKKNAAKDRKKFSFD